MSRAMRRPVVVVITEPRSARTASIDGTALEERVDLRSVHWLDSMDDEERAALLDAALPSADAIVVAPWTMRMPEFSPARWAAAPNLKVIAGTFDNRFGGWVDVADAQGRRVTLVDTSRSMTPTVAEFALAMTLNLLRDIPAAVQLVRSGQWKSQSWDQPGFVYGDLTGRRVGLAGYGSINRRYAELLTPFHCSLVTYDPFVSDADLARAGVRRAALLTELAPTARSSLSASPQPQPRSR